MKRFLTSLLTLVLVSSAFATPIAPKNVVLALSESLTVQIKHFETSEKYVIVDTMQYTSKNPDILFCRILLKLKNISKNEIDRDEQSKIIQRLKLLCYQPNSDTFITHDLDYGTSYWNLKKAILPAVSYQRLSFYCYDKSEIPVAFFANEQLYYLIIDEQNELYQKTMSTINK
jgi:hypothetical protein